MMMAAAVLALVGAEAMSISLARRSPSRVMPLAAGLSAVLLVLEWVLSLWAPAATAVVLYGHVAAFGGALVSGFWSLINERFDPYTARQTVGKIGAGAAAGGLVGGGLAWAASRVLANPTALLMLGALHGLAVLALLWTRGERVQPPVIHERAPALALPILARVPYLRTLALVVGLSALVDALLDYLFKAKTAELFAGPGAMMQVFALFHVGLSLLGLALQWWAAGPLLGRLGLVGTVSLRPALDLVTSLFGAAMPRFATAVVARGGHEALTNSLFRSSYELLYTPLPEVEKRRVKAVVDVAVDKAGTLIGGAVIATVLALWPVGNELRLFALAAVSSLCVLALSRRLHHGYVQALEQSLLSGRVKLAPGDVLDRTTELTLARSGAIDRKALLEQIAELQGAPGSPVSTGGETSTAPSKSVPAGSRDVLVADLEALCSGSSAEIQCVLRANPEPGPALVAALIPLLARNDLYPRVVRALRRAAPKVTGQLVDALLDPGVDLAVRRRVPRVLKACLTPRVSAGLQMALDDTSLSVRAAAAAGLAALCQAKKELAPPRASAFGWVRAELGRAPGGERQLAHVFTLLSLVLPQEPLRIAWAALRGTDPRLRGTALEYLATVLPDDLFAPLCDRCGGAAEPSGARRSADQVAADLQATAVGLRLERPPWRHGQSGGEPPVTSRSVTRPKTP